MATAAAIFSAYESNKFCCNPHANNLGNNDSDLLIFNFADADFNFDWSFIIGGNCKPNESMMASYSVKTHNTMINVNNIDETMLKLKYIDVVLHDGRHLQQLTFPEMYCGFILSILPIAKTKHNTQNKQKTLFCHDFTPLW